MGALMVIPGFIALAVLVLLILMAVRGLGAKATGRGSDPLETPSGRVFKE